MGLSEKTRHALAHDLKALLEGESADSLDKLKELRLSLERYRRELAVSITRHTNEERYEASRVAGAEQEVARWQNRLRLAREKAPELEQPAATRLDKERELLAAAREHHAALTRTIAHLKVNRDKVETTLRFVRRKKRSLEAEGRVVGEETSKDLLAAASLAEDVLGGTEPDNPPTDPIEDAFQALELDEVAGQVERRPKTP